MSQRSVGIAVPIPSAPLERPIRPSRLESWPPKWVIAVVSALCLLALGMTFAIVMVRASQATRLEYLECRVGNQEKLARQVLGERTGPLRLREC